MELAPYQLSSRKWRQLLRAIRRVATRHYRIGTAFQWTSYMVMCAAIIFVAYCVAINFMWAMTVGIGIVLVLFGMAFYLWGWATRGFLLRQEVVEVCNAAVPQLGGSVAQIRYHGRQVLDEQRHGPQE